MAKYQFICFTKRKNKEQTKEYNLINLALVSETSCDLIALVVNEQQIEKIKIKLQDRNFDISNIINVEFNSYSKQFTPKINI